MVGITVVALALAAWEVACRAEWISALALPSPSSILREASSLLAAAEFWRNWAHTILLWLLSVLGGLALGCTLGFAFGSIPNATFALTPVFAYLRAIPPIVLFPIAMVALGAGDAPIVLVGVLATALYTYPIVGVAARTATVQYRELAQVLGVGRAGFLYHFVVPATLVTTLAAARVAATLTFVICIAGEMLIGGRLGVGAAIVDMSERFLLAKAYGYVFFAGALGVAIDAAGTAVSRIGLVRQPGQRS